MQTDYYEDEDIDESPKTVLRRIDITDYVKTFLTDLSKREGKRIWINSDFEAERLKGLLNNPINTTFKSMWDMKTGIPYWNEQRVTACPSNLGKNKGVVFYFLCNGCHKRVKYLYVYEELKSPLCRTCCRLPYKKERYKHNRCRQCNGRGILV